MHAIQRKLAWGHRYLGRKDWLAKGIARFKRANGAQSFPYLPATYLLPDDRLKLIGISHAMPAACLGITRFRSVVHWLAEVASAHERCAGAVTLLSQSCVCCRRLEKGRLQTKLHSEATRVGPRHWHQAGVGS